VENRRRLFSFTSVWLGLGVVLFAIGAKLALIHYYGTDQPYADQWTAEGLYLVRGPLYYHLDWLQYFSPHGEHRPALSRLWLRGLVAANGGQWDCYAELVANLSLYALFLVLLWRWVARSVGGFALGLAALVMAILFALPCAYENFLWGFQSCFLFMLLAGVVHITWTMQSTRVDGRWYLAQLVGLAGLFSIAAGVMSAGALVAVAGFKFVRGQRNAWVWSTFVVNAFLLGLGLCLLNQVEVPSDGLLTRLGAAVARTGYLLSWPMAGAWWSLLLQAPMAWMLVSAIRADGNDATTQEDWRVIVPGLWIAFSSFAIAYGRNFTRETIGVRYYDVLLVGLLVNFVVLTRIQSRLTRPWRLVCVAGGILWVALLASGLWTHNRPRDLGPAFRYMHDLATEQRDVLRDFLVTSDPARLEAFNEKAHRFPQMEDTLTFLRDPKVPEILPPSLTPDEHAGPLSRLALRIVATWAWVMAAGGCLLVLGLVRSTRRSPAAPQA